MISFSKDILYFADQSMEVQSETEKPENSVQLSQQYIECLESLIAILRYEAVEA